MSAITWMERACMSVARGSGGRFAAIALLCATTAIAALAIAASPPRTSVYPQDIFGLLDGGWRIYNGQRMFHDYTPEYFALEDVRMAFALWLGRGTTAGIGYANAVLASLITLWTYLLLRARMNQVICAAASVTLALLVVSPSPLGSLVGSFSRAMEYNRLAYALLSLVVLELFLSPPESSVGNDVAGAISNGFILGTLTIQKPTFFLIGVSYVIFAALLGWVKVRRLAWIAGALVATLGIGYLLLRPGIGVIREVALVAGSHQGQMRLSLARVLGKSLLYQADFWTLVVTGSLIGMARPGWQSLRGKWRDPLFGAFTYFAGIGLLTTNAQGYGLPLTGIVLLIFVNRALHAIGKPSNVDTGRLVATVLLALAYWMGPTAKDGMSLLLAEKEHLDYTPPLPAELVAGIPGRELAFDGMDSFVEFVNEGTALLKGTSPQECVVSLTFTNIYPYLLGKKPCQGGRTFLPMDQLGDAADLPAETLIGSPDLILAPKPATFGGHEAEVLKAMLADTLENHYRQIGESKSWKLYRRSAGAQPAMPGLPWTGSPN